MTISVKVERTAKVTITLDEQEAAYLAALVGNVGGDDPNGVPLRTCRDIYNALISSGFTPPRFDDVYHCHPQRSGIFVRSGTALTGGVTRGE